MKNNIFLKIYNVIKLNYWEIKMVLIYLVFVILVVFSFVDIGLLFLNNYNFK
jgi:hypothetical protein